MTSFAQILPYIQLIFAVAVIVLVLLQRSEADLGGAFGGNDMMQQTGHTRRGLEKVLFNSTILVAGLFVISAVIGLIIR